MRRFASAAPCGLAGRLARPLAALRTGPAAAVRGLADISDASTLNSNKITKYPYADRPPPAPGAGQNSDLPRFLFANRHQGTKRAASSLRANIMKQTGRSPKLRVSGKLTSATRLDDETKGHVVLEFESVNIKVAVSSLWLRDSCMCPECVTPSSGQKTFHTHDLVSDEMKEVSVITKTGADGATEETALRVVWSCQQPEAGSSSTTAAHEHVSEYSSRELLQRLADCHVPRYPLNLPRRLWDRRTIDKALKPVSYADWMAPDNGSNAEFYRGLLDLYQLGILIVDDVPDSETAVREIATQIGNIQNTFYGELFDVVSKPNAENVAYTNVFLCLHQDLLYMNDPPYIQLLHCLRNECDGGESLFCDSVQVAVDMQVKEPEHFRVLMKNDVSYHYERNGHYYYNQRPVFEVDGAREGPQDIVKHTAWSPPFQDSFKPALVLDKEIAHIRQPVPDADFRDWAAAAKAFSDRLEHPDNMLEVKLKAGQCVLFNNRRVLHGRRQFNTSEGTRWLKGTYIDEQTFHSRVTDMMRRGVNRVAPLIRQKKHVWLAEKRQVLELERLRAKEKEQQESTETSDHV